MEPDQLLLQILKRMAAEGHIEYFDQAVQISGDRHQHSEPKRRLSRWITRFRKYKEYSLKVILHG